MPRRDTWVDGPPEGCLGAWDDRTGSMVGSRYVLLRMIGHGAGGVVYEAYDGDRAEFVAVKVLHPRLSANREHVQRFLYEARTAAAVGHAGVVRVFDAGVDDQGTVYQVHELLRGEPLSAWIERGAIPEDELIEIGRQLLAALGAAHGAGVLHRDVKPENVFVTRSESGAIHLKLIDFGIAKHLRPELDSGLRTLSGITLGTPHYMSPEQCRGETLDERSDLWSAGAVLYHAAAGRPPFADASAAALLVAIASGETSPSLAERRPDLPPEFVEVVDRALSHGRAERWPSARAMAEALSLASPSVWGLDWDELGA